MAARVWSTFSAKKINGGDVKLRIQDMPAERLDEVVNFLSDYYNNNDVFHKVVGLPKNPAAAEEATESMRQMFKAFPASIVICCEDNGDTVGEIIGAAATGVMTAKDKVEDLLNFNYKTKEVEKLFSMYTEILKLYDVFKGKNVDRYSDDRGLAVNSDYGVGVWKELLNVRRKLCKDQNVPLAVSWAMSDDMQKSTDSDGWETAFEISREEAGKKLGVTLTEGPATYKLMIGKAL